MYESELHIYSKGYLCQFRTIRVYGFSISIPLVANNPHFVLQVLCRMRSLPIPTRFRWTFNNSYEANEVPSDKYKSNGTLSKLNYR